MLVAVDLGFLGISETANPAVWELPVTAGITGGKGQLFGGCVVGAAAGLLEQITDRPVAWITCQFGTSATTGATVTLEAEIVSQGRSVTQARVNTTIDGRAHTTVLAALGTKAFADQSPTRPIPNVPAPDQCDPLDFDPGEGGLNRRVDVRSADEQSPDRRARSHLWFRFDGTTSGDLYSISIAADFFPPSLSAAIGRRVFGASLDNTIRFIDRAECDWLLVEMTVDSVQNGIAHGTNHLWAQDGRLLAIATQTCAVAELK